MFIFKFLYVLFIYSCLGYYLYMPHEETTFEVYAKGKVNITFGLKKATFMNNDFPPVLACDHHYRWQCDIAITYYVVAFGKTKYPLFAYGSQLLNSIRTGYIDHDKYIKEQVDVSGPEIYIAPDDQNIVGPSSTYQYDSMYYYQALAICYYAVDRDIFYNTEYLMSSVRIKFFLKNRETNLISTQSSDGKHKIDSFIGVQCWFHYYQPSCWMYCEYVQDKNTCDEFGAQICLYFWEAIPITYLYLFPVGFFDSWRVSNAIINKCIFWNPCALRMDSTVNHCPVLYEQCYPLRNATYTCSRFQPWYTVSVDPSYNFTYSSLVNTEFVKVDIRMTGEFNESIRDHSKCRWETIDVFRSRTMDDYTYPDTLITYEDIEYGRYYLWIFCIIGEFRYITLYREFVVHVKPKKVVITNTTLGRGLYLYLGQEIKCESNAVPQSRSSHVLSVMTNNFEVLPLRPNKHALTIPQNARLGFCLLNCSFTFIFRDLRPYPKVFTEWAFWIRTFVYFAWLTPHKNVFTIYDFTGCHHLAYFGAVISVIQLYGYDSIDIYPMNNFSTNVTTGGEYRFKCFLSVQYNPAVYYRLRHFDIYDMPSLVCLVVNFPTYGADLQCAHDGFPPDQAIYNISLSVSNYEFRRSTKWYIKIPYFMKYPTFTYTCIVTFFIHEMVQTFIFKKEIEMSHSLELVFDYNDADIACSKYLDKDLNFATEYGPSKMVLTSEIFELVILDQTNNDIMVMNIYLSMFCVPLTVILILFIRNSFIVSYLSVIRAFIVKRNLNDRLIFIAGLALTNRLDVVGMFSNKMTSTMTELSSEALFLMYEKRRFKIKK